MLWFYILNRPTTLEYAPHKGGRSGVCDNRGRPYVVGRKCMPIIDTPFSAAKIVVPQVERRLLPS